ncbi:MAG: hypothetical protein N2D54_03635, partial [Chloroflexota bacterium]
VSPPPYRARATLVIDFNLEDMLPGYEPRKTFHFLDRETRKAEEIAWADDTLSTVADKFGGVTVLELRSGKLALSQPSDGAWHLWAIDEDPEAAQELVSIWIDTFITNVRLAVELSGDVEDARAALAQAVYFTEDHDLEKIEKLTQELLSISETARGVTPYVGITLTQASQLPTERSLSFGLYIFVGAMLLAVISASVVIFSASEYSTE